MPDKNQHHTRDLFLLILILILLLIAGSYIYSQTRPGADGNQKSQDQQTGSSVTPTINLPDYQLADSLLAFPALIETAKIWSEDAKFISCTGVGTQYIREESKFYLGFEKGAFYKWSCFIYAVSKHQDTIIEWQNDVTSTKPAHVTYTGSQTEADPNSRAFYDLDRFVSSQLAFQTVLTNGFNETDDYQSIAIGLSRSQQLFGNKPVWEVHEYSRTALESPDDKYSQGKLVKIYYLDGITGELLQTEN